MLVQRVKRFAHFHQNGFMLPLLLLAVSGVTMLLVGATDVHAQTILSSIGDTVGFSDEPLPIVIAKLIRAFLGVIGIITVIIIIYAGWLYLSSQGDVTKITRAKEMLRQAAIGLLIIFGSFVLTQFILSALSGDAGNGGGGVRSVTPVTGFFETRSGSLGAGTITDHFPRRNAKDVPRNTSIFVTFTAPVDPTFFIKTDSDPNDGIAAGPLNTDGMRLFVTAKGEDETLTSSQVQVTIDPEGTTVVLDPVESIGSASEDVNYTVVIDPEVQFASGSPIFSGTYRDGYAWTFEVSTKTDDTPPVVVSVSPRDGSVGARNTAVEVTFSEPMHPLAISGAFDGAAKTFRNIEVIDSGTNQTISGTYRLSNNYQTVSFVSGEACAEDLCGNTVFCLPENRSLQVQVHAATVGAAAPQAQLIGGRFDGAVDASQNSLDGTRDYDRARPRETLLGSPADDVVWSFQTSGLLDRRTPEIAAISPTLEAEFVNPDAPVQLTFSMPMLSSSLRSTAIGLVPDTRYELPFWIDVLPANNADATVIELHHPTLVHGDDGSGMTYYPVVTDGVRGVNQFCAFPSDGPRAQGALQTEACGTIEQPFCCFGKGSRTACVRTDNTPLWSTPAL